MRIIILFCFLYFTGIIRILRVKHTRLLKLNFYNKICYFLLLALFSLILLTLDST